MRLADIKPLLLSVPAALLASLCCVLPLAVVLLGLGSGAFMMMVMPYSYIFIPLGMIGVGLGYFFYFRERRRCSSASCHMKAGKVNLAALVAATLLVVLALLFNLFPAAFAPLLGGG